MAIDDRIAACFRVNPRHGASPAPITKKQLSPRHCAANRQDNNLASWLRGTALACLSRHLHFCCGFSFALIESA